MAIPQPLKSPLERCATLIRKNLQEQAPVKTGALRRSIRVRPVETSDGYAFRASYKVYGIYLDKGTGPYASKARGKYNKNPGKGKGGIIPRFWTTLQFSTIRRVKQILAKAVDDFVIFELKRLVKKR
jgi:hypothetical protein